MSFKYSISGVPDLDQEWQALPNRGRMYCVPAASLNWIYYLAKHGRPSALAFPPSDTSNPIGDVMNLSMMAGYMDTDPQDGTGGDDGVDGLEDYLDDRNVPAIVIAESALDCGDITFGDLEFLTLVNALVVVIMGRYQKHGDEMRRTSGHAMTMVGFAKAPSGAIIKVHNPDDDNSNVTTQSATIKQEEQLTAETRNLEGDTVHVLRWGDSTDPFRFIDGVMAVQPLFALTNPTARTVIRHGASFDSQAIDSRSFELPFPGELVDIAIHPFLPTASFIARGSDDVWALDLARGAWTKTVRVPSPERLTFGGRDRRLFVAHGGEISSFDKAGKPLGRVAPAAGTRIEAISYDARADRLIVAPAGARRVVALSPDLKPLGDTEAPEVPGAGRLALSVSDRDGTIVLSRAGATRAATLRWHASGALASGGFHLLAGATSGAAHADRRGKLYAVEGAAGSGKIAAFDRDGNRTASVLDGLPAGPLLAVARSGHNFDPVRSRRKEWKNGGSLG